MKKLTAILFALILVLTAAAACAKDVNPLPSETLKGLLAGKTFNARVSGYGFAEDENGNGYTDVWLSFTICERDRYTAEDIQSLEVGDKLILGIRSPYDVLDITTDEYNYVTLNDKTEWYENLVLYPEEDGTYVSANATENPYWHDILSFEIEADDSMIFRDFSDPEAEEPTDRTLNDFLKMVSEEVSFNEDNTEITFDENGHLAVLLYKYTPWN